MNKFLTWLIGACLIGLCACGDDSSSNVGGNGSALVSGKCYVAGITDGYEKGGCHDFTLNEIDSTFSFAFTGSTGDCKGADEMHLSWNKINLKGVITYRYSIHGDTLLMYAIAGSVESADGSLNSNYAETSEKDSYHQVTKYVSVSHQGIKGTWKYDTSYHENPNIYSTPLMDNVMSFVTFGDDGFVSEQIPNDHFSFAKSELAEEILLNIYNRKGTRGFYVSAADAGYAGTLYPYDNPAVDIKLVSESKDKLVFKVSGKDVVFSNISAEVDDYAKVAVDFKLEYDGKECVFSTHFESISEKTCNSELVDNLEIYHDYADDDETVIGVHASHYESVPHSSEFQDCLNDMAAELTRE